jgi:hypothetical protein
MRAHTIRIARRIADAGFDSRIAFNKQSVKKIPRNLQFSKATILYHRVLADSAWLLPSGVPLLQ